jgi:hypothetical protein
MVAARRELRYTLADHNRDRPDEPDYHPLMESHSSQRGYPSFAELFSRPEGSPVPLYLELLSLSPGQGSELALYSIRVAIDQSPNVGVEIAALFAEVNWRPQLVGAVALLAGAGGDQTLSALWDAFDSGSWVSPQLVVLQGRIDG